MAVKRAVVKQQPVKRVRATKIDTYHAHGCTSCEGRYADRCDTPLVNGQCMTCTHGHDLTVERQDRAPKDCCKQHSARIEDAETLNRYSLGGPGPWWICKGPHGCYRTHPTNPKKEQP